MLGVFTWSFFFFFFVARAGHNLINLREKNKMIILQIVAVLFACYSDLPNYVDRNIFLTKRNLKVGCIKKYSCQLTSINLKFLNISDNRLNKYF